MEVEVEEAAADDVQGSVASSQVDPPAPTPSVPLRSSARVSQKKLDSLNKTLSPAYVDKRENDKGELSASEEKGPIKKPTSAMSVEEKNLFFEAVSEYGKDFAAIQRYFALKSKNKNGPVRTKDQIRRFYYRTWAKIAHKLHFPSYIPKPSQELYGLINYGELRKKCKGRTKKDIYRLNELVVKGWTQIRGKNKTVIIRTPRCRVLRKLCSVEVAEHQEPETKVPISIRVELTPGDNRTWAHVQSLAQNPRVNVHVPLQCRLSAVIQYLHRRWLPTHEKYKLKTLDRYEADGACLGDTGQTDQDMVILSAKPDVQLHVAQVNMNHYNSHTKICLSSYEERLGDKRESLDILNRLYAEMGGAGAKKPPKCDKSSDADVKDDTQPNNIMDKLGSTKVASPMPCMEEEEEERDVPSATDSTVIPPTEDILTRVREGWTQSNCTTLTVGDVYLMIGNDFKLQLDYRVKPTPTPEVGLSSLLSRLIRLSNMSRVRSPAVCRHVDAKRPRKDSALEDTSTTVSGTAVCAQVANDPVTTATFRRPVVHTTRRPAAGRMDAEAFKAEMDKLTPTFSSSNRRGRGTSTKTVVVQRTLPIVPDHLITHGTLKVLEPEVVASSEFATSIAVNVPPGAPPSPTPSISTILEEPFRPFTRGDNLESASTKRTGTREEWLSEVTECSLSSLLNHLDTPSTSKTCSSDQLDPTPPDVETHFQYMMTEASLDFTAKFAALAAEVISDN